MKLFNKTKVIKPISNKLSMSITDINIVFDGDSLTQGVGATNTQDYPNFIKGKIENSFNSFAFNSSGVGGQTTQQMIADAVTQIDVLVEPLKHNVIVAWEDVNSILNGGRTAQQNYDDFVSYFTDRELAGFDTGVLVLGYYPKKKLNGTYNQPTWNDTLFNIQEEYRELVRNTSGQSWDIFVDLTINPVLGGGRAQTINSYFNDSVHLTTKGYDEVGEWILQNGILKNFKK